MVSSIIKFKLTIFLLVISSFLSAQNHSNSSARNLIQNADISMVSRDWNTIANISSGTGETVSFFPIEITDLKSGQKLKALQVDMTISNCRDKTSWIDMNEISEFITFIESYVIPSLSNKTTDNKSNTYIFNSKEIVLYFLVNDMNNFNRLSVYLKENNVIEDQCYFWTETQIGKTRNLLTVLKSLK